MEKICPSFWAVPTNRVPFPTSSPPFRCPWCSGGWWIICMEHRTAEFMIQAVLIRRPISGFDGKLLLAVPKISSRMRYPTYYSEMFWVAK
eukprot:scaffold2270_cov156-Chaetoceros_neogracile.AAC.1